jgi:hypothetical protein
VVEEAEEDSAVEGSTAEDLAVGTSVVVEAFTLAALRWEDFTATVWVVLEESAIPLARGRHTGSQST